MSLTAIDSVGNTDPNPPMRKITVLPASPDFSIAVSPPATQIFPGQSAAFTVTVTPESGFNSPVSLSVGSESGFPTGITSGGFSPSQINDSGSSALQMNPPRQSPMQFLDCHRKFRLAHAHRVDDTAG